MNLALDLSRGTRRTVIAFASALLLWCVAPAGRTHPPNKAPDKLNAPQSAPLPFDLVHYQTDENGLPQNPQWGEQVNHPNSFPNPLDYTKCPNADFSGPQCTSLHQVSGINKATYSAPVCMWGGAGSKRANGHVNWTAATYTGSIYWGGPSLDGDYDWSLKPDNNAGLTTENDPRPAVPGAPKNPQFIHVEFDSKETSDAFQSPLWSRFKSYLDPVCSGATYTCDEAKGREMVDGRRAIVVGLLGLDSEHGGYSELHPVYAMALQTKPGSGNPEDDSWMLFARNWGNEGYCSSATETLPSEITTLKILLPQPEATAEITGVDITTDFYSFDTKDCPTATFIKDKGVLLTFNTPPPDFFTVPVRRPLIEGEVHLRWHSTGTIQPAKVEPSNPQIPALFREDQNELERAYLKRVLTSKERFQYFEIERQKESDLFHPGRLIHCTALAAAGLSTNLSNANVASTDVKSNPDALKKSISVAVKNRTSGYRTTKERLMRQSLRDATRRDIH